MALDQYQLSLTVHRICSEGFEIQNWISLIFTSEWLNRSPRAADEMLGDDSALPEAFSIGGRGIDLEEHAYVPDGLRLSFPELVIWSECGSKDKPSRPWTQLFRLVSVKSTSYVLGDFLSEALLDMKSV